MKNKRLLILSALSLTLLCSCRKEFSNVERPESYLAGSFSQVFDAFWNGMNNNYLLWEADPVNWDDVYKKYKPIFAGLDIHKMDDVKKSVQYFREMTTGLSDSHFTLSFHSPIADSIVDPARERKLAAGPLPTWYVFYNYDAAYYLDSGYVSGKDPINLLNGDTTRAVSGTINKNILYLGFNQFNLKAAFESADNGVKSVLQYFIAQLKNPDLKGIIIDVRGNRGGSVADLNLLIGNMISNKLTIGYTRYKNGNGRLDYTPWAPAIVTPQAGAADVKVPVAALTDAWTESMGEITAMSVHALKNGFTVGQKTWGATGPLALNQMFNGGQFTAANFVFAYTSSSAFKYIDGKTYEGKGFPPDYDLAFDLTKRGDNQLEKAISLMH